MNETIIVSGIEVITENVICPKCDYFGVPDYTLLESNKAMQMRCAECGKFLGNCKYSKPEDFVMPYGAHKGKKLIDCPEEYLKFLFYKTDLTNNISEKIEAVLRMRDAI